MVEDHLSADTSNGSTRGDCAGEGDRTGHRRGSNLVGSDAWSDVLSYSERSNSGRCQDDIVTVVEIAVGGSGLNPLDPLTVSVVLELGQAGWAGDRRDPRFFVVG